jgi:hypothetical protein
LERFAEGFLEVMEEGFLLWSFDGLVVGFLDGLADGLLEGRAVVFLVIRMEGVANSFCDGRLESLRDG